jgi:hypothetical protein
MARRPFLFSIHQENILIHFSFQLNGDEWNLNGIKWNLISTDDWPWVAAITTITLKFIQEGLLEGDG